MKAVENWVRDIVFYMIFVTMVMNLLPDPKYEKYLRLFAGAVMILLAFGPVLRITGMETAMAGICPAGRGCSPWTSPKPSPERATSRWTWYSPRSWAVQVLSTWMVCQLPTKEKDWRRAGTGAPPS